MRCPVVADAAAIDSLVRESGGLDANSVYCYLLICSDFANTSLVAEDRDGLVGFVAAYRPPGRPADLFVWQIGVAARARRQGVGRLMLNGLVDLPACRDARFLQATVTPSNLASRKMFEQCAKELGVALHVSHGFSADLFGAAPHGQQSHEAEDRLSIGPLGQAELTETKRGQP